METTSYCRAGECLAIMHPSNTSIAEIASVSSWLANGFRLNWTASAASRLYGWVVWKGGSWAVGDVLTQTSTGTFSETGVGFAPKGALFVSHCKAQSASATQDAGGELSIGAASGASNQAAHGTLDEDGTGSSEVATAVEHDSVYVNISNSDTVEGKAALTTFGADGFTLDQTDADPAQAFVWYLAGGDGAAVHEGITLPEVIEITLDIGGALAAAVLSSSAFRDKRLRQRRWFPLPRRP